MKTKEEIDKTYLQVCKDNGSKEIASEYCGFIKGYTQCQEDMADNFLSLIEEYREKELPNKDVPYHYEAEIDSGLKYLLCLLKTANH